MTQKPISGFTLLELSIVLIIIGLLVGGVLVGRNLLRISEMDSLQRTIETIRSAYTTFQTKYNYPPADIPDATNYWPQLSPGCTYPQNGSPLTCNGNGNLRIGEGWASEEHEKQLSWQHLILAGMLPGPMPAIPSSPTDSSRYVSKDNPGSTFYIGFSSTVRCSNPTVCAFDAARYFAGMDSGNSMGMRGRGITAQEAYNLDLKTDDGLPGTGRVFSRKEDVACITTTDPITARYTTTTTDEVCNPQFGLEPNK